MPGLTPHDLQMSIAVMRVALISNPRAYDLSTRLSQRSQRGRPDASLATWPANRLVDGAGKRHPGQALPAAQEGSGHPVRHRPGVPRAPGYDEALGARRRSKVASASR